jgi:hypothetical protein
MGVGRAHHTGVQRVREPQIVGEAALAGEEPAILEARDRLPNGHSDRCIPARYALRAR